MPSLKYLRPQSTVMLGDAGINPKSAALATGSSANDVLLGFSISFSDGSGQELIGIQLSDRQLERLKQDIVLYQQARDKANCQESQESTSSGDRPTETTIPPLSTESSSVFSIDPELIDFRYTNDLLEARTSISNSDGTCRLEAIGRGFDEGTAKLALNRNIQRLVDGMQIQRNINELSLSSFTPFASHSVTLKLDPKVVIIKDVGNYIEASVTFPVSIPALGTINPEKLAVLSKTENGARMALEKKFQELVYSVIIKHE